MDTPTNKTTSTTSVGIQPGYVDAPTLLKQLFPHGGLCLRTLRTLQATRRIPYLKIGKRVLFNPAEVIAALEKQFARKAVAA